MDQALTAGPLYWVSYSKQEFSEPAFLQIKGDPRRFNIAVVLDPGAREDFSGIRVIIVATDDTGVIVKDRLDIDECRDKRYRTLLTILRPSRDSVDDGKICTVALEVEVNPHVIDRANATLRPFRQRFNSYVHRQPRIIYDHVQMSTAPLFLSLKCSHPILRNDDFKGMDFGQSTQTLTARILPISSRSTSLSSLPFTLLSRVVLHAIFDNKERWRRSLLSFGLVCKSWAPLLDLFFSHFCNHVRPFDKGYEYLPRIEAVARSLEMVPRRAALIKRYTPRTYLRPVKAEHSHIFWKAQNTILRLAATSLQHLHIDSTRTDDPSFQEFIDIISGLRGIQTFQLSGPWSKPSWAKVGDLRNLVVEDIQRIICLWPHLTSLILTSWDAFPTTWNSLASQSLQSQVILATDAGHVVEEGMGAKKAQLVCPIEELRFYSGELTRSQLLIFASPTLPLPRLQRAKFYYVKGLTNSHFLGFLTRVASTLVSLTVIRSEILRGGDEEYAIDATMPSMLSLETLSLEGDVASASVISGKIKRQGRDTDGRKDTMQLYNLSFTDHESIVHALGVTGWDVISIGWHKLPEFGVDLIREGSQIAAARGINLKVQA
ncbi:hypothetical protein D9615_001544 [Tricholomella constricta]|uniref:Uncharacterized protein n=1 Tax=Tricholomella constricta TaxID=117010 RepID=A0A8H5HNL6_9AGAR|nr:hypothetical protein D9615_001544 [Tricholomella constricta]